MERTFTPHPKILLHIRILQIWEVRPKDLKALTSYSSYKEKAYIHGILVNSIPLYKHQAFSSPRYVNFLTLILLKLLEVLQSVIDLTFRGSLAGILPVLSINSSLFVLQIPPFVTHVDDCLTEIFSSSQSISIPLYNS